MNLELTRDEAIDLRMAVDLDIGIADDDVKDGACDPETPVRLRAIKARLDALIDG